MSSTSITRPNYLRNCLPILFNLFVLILCGATAFLVIYAQYQFNSALIQLNQDIQDTHEQRLSLMQLGHNKGSFNTDQWIQVIDDLGQTESLPGPIASYLPNLEPIDRETSKQLKLRISELALQSSVVQASTPNAAATSSTKQLIEQLQLDITPLLIQRLESINQQKFTIERWQQSTTYLGLIPISLLMIIASIYGLGKIRSNQRHARLQQVQSTALEQLQIGYVVVNQKLEIIISEMKHLELGLDTTEVNSSLEQFFHGCMDEEDLRSWKLSLQNVFLNPESDDVSWSQERTIQVNGVSTSTIFHLISQGVPRHQPKWIITTWQAMMVPCLTPDEDTIQLKKDFNQRLDLIETLTQLDTEIAGDFFHETQALLQSCRAKIGELSQSPKQPLKIVNKLLQVFHQIKGDAAILGLHEIEHSIHALEDYAQHLALSSQPDALILQELSLQFDKTEKRFDSITALFKRFTQYQEHKENHAEDALSSYIQQYAHKIARDCHKKIKIIDENLHKHLLPADKYRQITTLISQLIRNAIAHGIEPPDTRVRNHKTEYGCLHIILKKLNNRLTIKIRDDGQGIDIKKVVTKAISLGLFDIKNKQKLSQQELLQILTHPGLSTKDDVNEHSGRGVGLELVKNILGNLNGKISLDTKPGQFTEFSLSVPI